MRACASQGLVIDVSLERIPTAKVGYTRQIFDFFTEEIDRANKDHDEDYVTRVQEILELWEGMLIAQHDHDEALKQQIRNLRIDCISRTDELASVLASFDPHLSFLHLAAGGEPEESEDEEDEDGIGEKGSLCGTPRCNGNTEDEDSDGPVTEFSSRKSKTSPRIEFSQRSRRRVDGRRGHAEVAHCLFAPPNTSATVVECKRLCKGLDKVLGSDVFNVLSVPAYAVSAGFSSKATVGLMLVGVKIENMVVGGPAHTSCRLSKGDVLLKVDDVEVDSENLHAMLIGSDVPGSLVKITFLHPGSEEEHEVNLMRAATSSIADNVRMFEIFTHLKDQAFQANDRLATTLLDEALEIFTGALVQQGDYKSAIQDNLRALQDQCRELCRELFTALHSLHVSGSLPDPFATNDMEDELDECPLVSNNTFSESTRLKALPVQPTSTREIIPHGTKAMLNDDMFMEMLEPVSMLDDDMFADMLEEELQDDAARGDW